MFPIMAAAGAAGSLMQGASGFIGGRESSNQHPANQIFWDIHAANMRAKNLRKMSKAAGISPLTMLGAGAIQGSPVTAFGKKERPIARGMRSMGQSIAQLPTIKASIEESAAKSNYYNAMAEAARREPTTSNITPQNADQAKSVGEGQVITKPKERISTRPGQPNVEAGSMAETQFIDTATGKKPVESEKAGEVYEQQGELATAARFANKVVERGWLYARNYLKPRHYAVIRNMRPRSKKVGTEYRYDPLSGEYRLARIGPEGPQTFHNRKLWKIPTRPKWARRR